MMFRSTLLINYKIAMWIGANRVACLLIVLLSLLTQQGCKKDEALVKPPNNSLYFNGSVLRQNRFLKDSLNGYRPFYQQLTSGTFSETMRVGLTTLPYPKVGDEHIHIQVEILNMFDSAEFHSVFAIGEKTFQRNGQNGFLINYGVVKSVDTASCSSCAIPAHYQVLTSWGNQDGSTIEVIDKHPLPPPPNNGYKSMKVTLRINCKLYDENNIYKGDIKDGILATAVHYL